MKEMYVGLSLSIGLGFISASLVSTLSAQPLTKDIPTGNLTEDIDIAINPTEALPPNGTVTMSTEGATDMDINEFPPAGITIIIQNDTVIVTNNAVNYQ
jgi:hypothetical protein